MATAFTDKENLYLALDLLTGGDLRFHLGKMKRFNENQSSLHLNIYIFKNSLLLASFSHSSTSMITESYIEI